jgi:glutamate transport system substrate-binding protein
VAVPIADRDRALVDGRVDLVVDVYSITDERRKSVLFAGPYLITQQGVMVRAGDRRIRNLAQLDGKSVCTPAGSTSREQLTEGGMKDRVVVIEELGMRECVDSLLAGEVDAVSADQLILYGFARADRGHLSVVPALRFGAHERYGIGLRRGEVARCEALTGMIKDFIVNGEWDRFFEANFGDLPRRADYKPDVDRLDPC